MRRPKRFILSALLYRLLKDENTETAPLENLVQTFLKEFPKNPLLFRGNYRGISFTVGIIANMYLGHDHNFDFFFYNSSCEHPCRIPTES